ncbi:electron transfer flavoprotein subunit beta/FixA family protein [Nocardioides speluncae]|uniref:electron transfer flavoprotein subunit beta/FixA family protein n=1 Tax=Nocardioides speluncae TaxID=2670337 RepID=UPI000D699FFA|nr:electron transfer flavoprotein subunit alpha [Nocardioides speluncae]
MVNVLVCIKRVPDTSESVLLTDDAMAVDGRHVGYTVSPHELCAVELAVQAAADGGTAGVVSVGSGDAVEQLRDALAVGVQHAVLVEADDAAFGPADVAAALAEVVEAGTPDGTPYDLVLLGNDAADTGDFQVGIRLAYALGRPVVSGVSTIAVSDGVVQTTGAGPAGTEVFEVPLPAVVTVMEGGVAPRYPSVMGRVKAKKAEIDTRTPSVTPRGNGRVRLKLPPEQPSQVVVLGEGAAAAPALVDLFETMGVLTK